MINSLIYSILAGTVGTVLGGLLGMPFKNSKNAVSRVFDFSAGIILALVAFEILPETLMRSNALSAVTSFAVGIALVVLAKQLFSKFLPDLKNSSFKTGIIIMIAVGIHNFPEGLALGSGEIGGIGLSLAVLVSLHNIPSGMSMTIPLLQGGISAKKCLAYSAVTSLPTIIGAVIGSSMALQSPILIPYCLGISAGSMTYITFSELIPSGGRNSNSSVNLLFIPLGFFIGMLLCGAL